MLREGLPFIKLDIQLLRGGEGFSIVALDCEDLSSMRPLKRCKREVALLGEKRSQRETSPTYINSPDIAQEFVLSIEAARNYKTSIQMHETHALLWK